MILWTIMPEELVFSQEANPSPYEEIEFSGAKMMVEKVSVTQCRIVRILSSDPADYLRQDIQPGTVLIAKTTYELLQ
jgi:hypothetical protein